MMEEDEEHHDVVTVKSRPRRWCLQVACISLTAFLAIVILIAILTIQLTSRSASNKLATRPNILFILLDDLGFNDIGYHNSAVRTPHLDEMATRGRVLEQHYMQPMCTPSRHALMTGIYPFKSKMQNFIVLAQNPRCSPTDMEFLPAKLKPQGYHTHLVGKWHLGFCQEACLPMRRGFDTFYGPYNGMVDHYTLSTLLPEPKGYDWHDNTSVDVAANGTHTTDLLTDRALKLLEQHDITQPFFLQLSYLAVHKPLQAPQRYIDSYSHIEDEKRRHTYAMMTHLDDRIKDVVDVLKIMHMYDNTLIIVASDNGGDYRANHDNRPLRGSKGGLWEGGTRTVSFVTGPLVHNTPDTHHGLMHVVDWHRTILSLAGLPFDASLDGVDQSEMLLLGAPSRRTDMVYNIDMIQKNNMGQAAIRVGDYKLIWGFEGTTDGWGDSLTYVWRYPSNLREVGLFPSDLPPVDTTYGLSALDRAIRTNLTATRWFDPEDLSSGRAHLFNLKEDPEERMDLSDSAVHQERLVAMKRRVLEILPQLVPPSPESTEFWTKQAVAAMTNHSWSTGWCDNLNLELASTGQWL